MKVKRMLKKLKAITENMYLVPGDNQGKFPYSHSFLITDEDTALIDTGCGIGTLKELKKGYEIDYIINSHTHPDHSAGNWVFRDRPIFVPEEGFNTSGDLELLSKRFVSEELTLIWQEFVKKQMLFKNIKPTHSYDSRTIFNFGKIKLEPIHTPGHTGDHYCFFERTERVLFSFDYDLTSFPWYGHRESSISEFKESLKKLRALLPEIVSSSHREMVTVNMDAEFDKFEWKIDERNERIFEMLESEKTIDQLAEQKPIYGAFPYAEPLLRYWESQMIKKHLEQLIKNGRIKETSQGRFHMQTFRMQED
jgi:glyoxylase-like metal-dependent hydrolase (beta-lactamase superfamily II)